MAAGGLDPRGRSDALSKDLIDGLVRTYTVTRYVNYLAVAGCALVVVDFLHTFPDEVRLIWPTPRSLPKYLFFAVRYYAVINAMFALMFATPVGMSPKQCYDAFLRVTTILLLRAYAFSGRNTGMLVFLVTQFVAIHTSAFVLFAKFVKTAEFSELSKSGISCVPAHLNSSLLGAIFTLTLCSIAIVMFMMVYITFREYYQNFNCSLLTVFYRDGLFYFFSLSALAAANIIVNFAAPEGGYGFLVVQSEVNIHAILSTRMLLHLRSRAESEMRRRSEYHMTDSPDLIEGI